MRLVSHTCSNTEIVCALGCADLLVGVDDDSDFPPDSVAALPKLGRDLELDIARVRALKPDLVLTSLTVPGHEKIVDALQAAGLRTLVCNPQSLEDGYADIGDIADALEVPRRGSELVTQMRAAMPRVPGGAHAPTARLEVSAGGGASTHPRRHRSLAGPAGPAAGGRLSRAAAHRRAGAISQGSPDGAQRNPGDCCRKPRISSGLRLSHFAALAMYSSTLLSSTSSGAANSVEGPRAAGILAL